LGSVVREVPELLVEVAKDGGLGENERETLEAVRRRMEVLEAMRHLVPFEERENFARIPSW
jgi:hypothetical protein